MPREKIPDPFTDGLYVMVNWRRAGEDPPDPYVQVSTHDERADARVRELLDSGARLVAALTSAVRSGETMSNDLEWVRAEWFWKLDTFRAELTGSFVTLTPGTAAHFNRTLHRARAQAWPPESLVSGALDQAPSIPAAPTSAAEHGVTGPAPMPPPGATGYQVSQPPPLNTGYPRL